MKIADDVNVNFVRFIMQNVYDFKCYVCIIKLKKILTNLRHSSTVVTCNFNKTRQSVI